MTCTWMRKVIYSRLLWTSACRIHTRHSDLYHLPLLCTTAFLASAPQSYCMTGNWIRYCGYLWSHFITAYMN
ncbi:hypothetical protein BD769DRAFT_1529310 [Suillus cothurnatus]|nr:hypothetical protein BD769DRAFT_1529310 [Suillus cothurnatus]